MAQRLSLHLFAIVYRYASYKLILHFIIGKELRLWPKRVVVVGGELIWFSAACEKLIESQNSIVFIIK